MFDKAEMTRDYNAKGEWILSGVFAIVLIACAAAALYYGGKAVVAGISFAEAQRATAECEKWQDWERVYPKWDERTQTGYYITQWQKDQCDSVGVELRAHVATYKR